MHIVIVLKLLNFYARLIKWSMLRLALVFDQLKHYTQNSFMSFWVDEFVYWGHKWVTFGLHLPIHDQQDTCMYSSKTIIIYFQKRFPLSNRCCSLLSNIWVFSYMKVCGLILISDSVLSVLIILLCFSLFSFRSGILLVKNDLELSHRATTEVPME